MVVYGRGIGGGSWLPEDKKSNMWYGGEIVVAHGRLPSPAPGNIKSTKNADHFLEMPGLGEL